jgi:hypothetical protein
MMNKCVAVVALMALLASASCLASAEELPKATVRLGMNALRVDRPDLVPTAYKVAIREEMRTRHAKNLAYFRTSRATKPSQSFDMGGNVYPLGIYFVEIGLGVPPQIMKVAVDTGYVLVVVAPPKATERASPSRGVSRGYIL